MHFSPYFSTQTALHYPDVPYISWSFRTFFPLLNCLILNRKPSAYVAIFYIFSTFQSLMLLRFHRKKFPYLTSFYRRNPESASGHALGSCPSGSRWHNCFPQEGFYWSSWSISEELTALTSSSKTTFTKIMQIIFGFPVQLSPYWEDSRTVIRTSVLTVTHPKENSVFQ